MKAVSHSCDVTTLATHVLANYQVCVLLALDDIVHVFFIIVLKIYFHSDAFMH